MRQIAVLCAVVVLVGACAATGQPVAEEGWHPLFDGKTLDGWKASENVKSFSVVDGKIQAFGPRSHLFYVGPVGDHSFRNFELKLEVMTTPGSNSGVYFGTAYQERGWPGKGIECQVNATHKDWKRTGSLYNIVNVREAHHKDGEWFTYHIIVNGRTVVTKVDGKTVVEYAEPPDARRKLSSGTICLQGHDPKSRVFYRNIRIKPLPD
jgi:hypothetical protein